MLDIKSVPHFNDGLRSRPPTRGFWQWQISSALSMAKLFAYEITDTSVSIVCAPRYPEGRETPTTGAAQAATAPSKDLSKAYTVLLFCSGTISAKKALLFVPHLQASKSVHVCISQGSFAAFCILHPVQDPCIEIKMPEDMP